MKKSIFSTVFFLALFASAYSQTVNWRIDGNNNINGSRFLGTTTAQSLRIFTDSIQRMVVSATGNVGIGTTNPLYPFAAVSNSAARTADILNQTDSPSQTYGLTVNTDNDGAGNETAAHISATGDGTGSNYAVFGSANGGGYNYALYGSAVAAVGQTAYGLYASASGSGTTYAARFNGRVWMNNNLGIDESDPVFPLHFGPVVGDKICLYQNPAVVGNYGIGVQSNRLQIHMAAADDNILFGYGTSAAFTELMRIGGNGQIGIGTASPLGKLHIDETGTDEALVVQIDGASKLKVNNNGSVSVGGTSTGPIDGLYVDGSVVIGNAGAANGFKVSVDGKVVCEELKVQLSQNWPDYVFAPEYNLMPLAEVEQHIAEKGHLPGIPSAAEVTGAQGIEVGEMQRLMLEKIEELTLYILQLEKEIQEIKK